MLYPAPIPVAEDRGSCRRPAPDGLEMLPRCARGLPTMKRSAGRASPSDQAETRRREVRTSSFSPAVPPTCHKQRSPAVSSGQSRSLGEVR
jgi:hypothetical protein